MNRLEKLKRQIDNAKKLEEFSGLSDIQIQNATFNLGREGKSVPKMKIRGIYSVRSEINKSRGEPIKGFNLLLRNLDFTKSENVSIHEVADNDFEYIIFTDPNIDELLGILRIPKKN